MANTLTTLITLFGKPASHKEVLQFLTANPSASSAVQLAPLTTLTLPPVKIYNCRHCNAPIRHHGEFCEYCDALL